MLVFEVGVMFIEYGFLFDCEIVEIMNEKGVYIIINLIVFDLGLLDILVVKN